VADGTVSRIAGDVGISGNRIHVRHDDGWSTLYIHLNNDTAGTDDGNGRGIRAGLEEGDRVDAGQVIGWTGDSGNAEETNHHLHFELRDPDGNPVDPEASLRAADRSVAPGTPEDRAEFEGAFADSISSSAAIDPMTFLLSRGAPISCDEVGALACPGEPATAETVGAWLVPVVGEVSLLPAGQHEAQCSENCPEVVITRAELERALAWDRLRDHFAVWGFGLEGAVPDTAWTTPVLPPPDHPSDLSLETASEMLWGGVSCRPPEDSSTPLTRAEAAEWIARQLGWVSDQCLATLSRARAATR